MRLMREYDARARARARDGSATTCWSSSGRKRAEEGPRKAPKFLSDEERIRDRIISACGAPMMLQRGSRRVLWRKNYGRMAGGQSESLGHGARVGEPRRGYYSESSLHTSWPPGQNYAGRSRNLPFFLSLMTTNTSSDDCVS